MKTYLIVIIVASVLLTTALILYFTGVFGGVKWSGGGGGGGDEDEGPVEEPQCPNEYNFTTNLPKTLKVILIANNSDRTDKDMTTRQGFPLGIYKLKPKLPAHLYNYYENEDEKYFIYLYPEGGVVGAPIKYQSMDGGSQGGHKYLPSDFLEDGGKYQGHYRRSEYVYDPEYIYKFTDIDQTDSFEIKIKPC